MACTQYGDNNKKYKVIIKLLLDSRQQMIDGNTFLHLISLVKWPCRDSVQTMYKQCTNNVLFL